MSSEQTCPSAIVGARLEKAEMLAVVQVGGTACCCMCSRHKGGTKRSGIALLCARDSRHLPRSFSNGQLGLWQSAGYDLWPLARGERVDTDRTLSPPCRSSNRWRLNGVLGSRAHSRSSFPKPDGDVRIVAFSMRDRAARCRLRRICTSGNSADRSRRVQAVF
jgi:hypothetical protein